MTPRPADEAIIKPVRLQLSRRKGFSLQAWSREVNGLTAIMVTRSTRWGNPYRAGDCISTTQAKRWGWRLSDSGFVCEDAARAARKFAACVALDDVFHPVIRRELGGKNLACFCRLCPAHQNGRPLGMSCEACAPCHADVLLEIANR